MTSEVIQAKTKLPSLVSVKVGDGWKLSPVEISIPLLPQIKSPLGLIIYATGFNKPPERISLKTKTALSF